MRRFRLAFAIALCATTASHAGAQNQLQNPGFEFANLSGWVVGGSSGAGVNVGPTGSAVAGVSSQLSGTSRVHSGTYSAAGAVAASASQPGLFTLTQTLSLTVGSTYNVGYWFANTSSSTIGIRLGPDNPNVRGAEMDIFLNGAGLLPTSFMNATALTWYNVASSFVASQTVNTITFQLTGSGSAHAPMSVDDFYVDDANLVVTPEPATLTLVASGLMGAMALRRRRRGT